MVYFLLLTVWEINLKLYCDNMYLIVLRLNRFIFINEDKIRHYLITNWILFIPWEKKWVKITSQNYREYFHKPTFWLNQFDFVFLL